MARSAKKIEYAPAEQIGVIYARYSSHNQKEESIEQQIAECTEFAEKNGIRIIGIYADKAVSGRSDRRPNFQRMMRDAEKRHFQIVVAYKSNRIARNMLNALQYEAKLDSFGIKTLYAKEEFGNTAAGRFALRTMMNVNQFYSENMGEDIKRGMVDNATECKVNGMLPLGYVKGEDGKYAIAADEAAVVREIYDSVLKDIPLAEIARSLNQRGIRTKLGRDWNKNSFHILLKNDNYIGVYRHSGVVVEDGIPPILDKEVFEAVQEKLTNKKKTAGRRSANGEYLLTGKLFCGYCGSYMIGVSGTGENGTVHNYYQCQKRHAEGRCEKKNVRRDFIEKLIARLTQDYILQDDTIEWIADSTMSFQAMARRESGVAQLERDLADNRKVAKNIMAAIEQGIITETTKARLLEVEGTIHDLERSLSIAKAASQPIERERVVFSLEQMREGNVGSKDHQKKLIDTFVKSVTLWDDRIQIDYYHTPGKHKFSYSLEELTSKAENESNASDVRTDSLELHQIRDNPIKFGLSRTFLCGMRTQRLQNDWLPIFDGKVLKFLKRHIEVNLNIVVTADANGFDELRNDHFLCLKGAGVEQICPCEQSVVFLPQILRRSQQRLIFCLCRVYAGLRQGNHRFCFFHQCVQKLHAEIALTANDFQRFRLIIGEVFLLFCQMRIGLIELDSCKLDFFFMLVIQNLGFRRGSDLCKLHADHFLHNTVELCDAIARLSVAFAGMSDVVMALVSHPRFVFHCAICAIHAPAAGRQCQPISAVGTENISNQEGFSLAVQRHVAMRERPLAHDLLCLGKGGNVDDA